MPKSQLFGNLIKKSQDKNLEAQNRETLLNTLGRKPRARILQSNNVLNGFNAETGRALTLNGARSNATEPQGTALSVPKPVHLEPLGGFSIWN